MCFPLHQGMPSYQSVGIERHQIQSVTMHAGLCDAAYCLVSVEKRAQRPCRLQKDNAQTLSFLVVE